MNVTAGVIRDGNTGRYLVAQRGPGSGAGVGKWEFPGGKARMGEALGECLARELDEELGICVEVGAVLGVVEVAYDDRGPFVVHFMETRIVRGEPEAREHASIRWVSPVDLPDLDLSKADRRFVLEMLG